MKIVLYDDNRVGLLRNDEVWTSAMRCSLLLDLRHSSLLKGLLPTSCPYAPISWGDSRAGAAFLSRL